ncbi:MAG TPA: hypothetical protein VEC36_01075 [Patescibacteria group bacterium]|nr:hypothetical protein [Patescibacteria group bacterium]
MIEVFKTDVREQHHAEMLVTQICNSFKNYSATFDLTDCDKILRVDSPSGEIHSATLIEFLKEFGISAEVLPE